MLIKTENLTKKYKLGKETFVALDKANLEIEDGEFVAIQGTSGAGKSTLLHILGCLDDADDGKYYLNGVDVFSLNDRKTAKLRNEKIGFVLQDFSLINHKKVGFNVMLPLYFNHTPNRQMKEMAHKALEAVGIDKQFDKKANQLSGGQRQRVAIARAIVNNPSVIFADEPTGALDSKSAKMLLEKFDYLNKELQATILMVTHDAFTASYSSRVIFIKDGKIFNEIIKGTNSRKEFFDKIIDVVTLLGGDLNDAL